MSVNSRYRNNAGIHERGTPAKRKQELKNEVAPARNRKERRAQLSAAKSNRKIVIQKVRYLS